MLPFELWMEICSLACCDDGHTGRTLSLVSHLFYDASKPYKHRSVAVRGIHQIISFVRYLESLPVEDRNVENLYLMTGNAGQLNLDDVSSRSFKALADFYQPGVCDRFPGPSSEYILKDGRELLFHAISRLLISLSAVVRTVHLVLGIHREFIFFPVKFQRLEELAIQGPFEFSDGSFIPHLPTNPTLRRLKLTFVYYYNGKILASIAAFSPRLTHLYCSLPNPYRPGTIKYLREFFPLSPDSGPETDQFPQSLQKLYVHPHCRRPPRDGIAFTLAAKRLLRAYCMGHPKIVLLKEYPSEYSIWEVKEGEKEWLDRINGGRGCWDDSNKESGGFALKTKVRDKTERM